MSTLLCIGMSSADAVRYGTAIGWETRVITEAEACGADPRTSVFLTTDARIAERLSREAKRRVWLDAQDGICFRIGQSWLGELAGMLIAEAIREPLERIGIAKRGLFVKPRSEFISFLAGWYDERERVLVAVYDGAISKNIIDSGVFASFLEKRKRVIVWSDRMKERYYTDRYGGKGFEIVPYQTPAVFPWEINIQNFVWDMIPTRSILLKHKRRIVLKKKYVLGAIRIALWWLGHLRSVRWVLQKVMLAHPIHLHLRSLVSVERPDLIFCGTMVSLEEVDLVRLGKHRGIKTAGMVKSWDNITSKLVMPVFPDRLLANTEIVREEAVKYLGYPREHVDVVGMPQYDRYHDPALQETRGQFCARTGLDPAKPFVLFCAAGLWMSPNEPQIILDLDRAIDEGVFGPLQVLVRVHPKYDCGAEQLTGCKHVIVERPGTYVGESLQRWEYEDHDLRHLISSLRFAAVTLNTASTMAIEASYFDRPVVLLAYDPLPQPYWLSIARYYEREHMVPLVQANGAKMARSFFELCEAIKLYLAKPETDHEGRMRVVREQCVFAEAKSAAALGAALLTLLTGRQK